MQIDTTEDFSGVANLSKSFTTVNSYSTVKTTAPPTKYRNTQTLHPGKYYRTQAGIKGLTTANISLLPR